MHKPWILGSLSMDDGWWDSWWNVVIGLIGDVWDSSLVPERMKMKKMCVRV